MSKTAPESYIAARVEKLRGALHDAKAPENSVLLVTNFADVSWLTGFEGDDSYALVTDSQVVLLSDTRYQEQITKECPWTRTIIRKKGMFEEVAKQLKRLHHKGRIALGVQSESLTLKGQFALRKNFKEAGLKVKLIALPEIIVKLRHIKDAREVALTEKAIQIAENAFVALRCQIKAGQTENDLAGLLGYEMRKGGALNSSFDSIVGAGPNGSLPHYRPGDVPLAANSPLLIDWGARYKGYCSDLTRVVFLGNVAPKLKEIYQVVLEAQLAAIAAIKPGAHGKKVDKAARDIIKRAGYGDQFGHGTGHGLGRDIHENISLSKLSTTTLEPGMLITVEPGIYLPGIGGVRLEDDILVTSTGHRVLSSLPKDLDWASLG